jgi:hypothetical protein
MYVFLDYSQNNWGALVQLLQRKGVSDDEMIYVKGCAGIQFFIYQLSLYTCRCLLKIL